MEPLSKDTVNVKAYAALKRAIMSAYFKPGEILTLRSLSTLLGTSDMPVREALRQLVAERAVEALPNRSTRIPILSLKKAREIIDTRCMLEGYATELAAKNRSKEELEEISAEKKAADEALNGRDFRRYLEHNTTLHFLIYKSSGSETLVPLIESLWLQYAPTFNLSFARIAADPEKLIDTGRNHHSAILTALRRKESDMAREAMEADIRGPTTIDGFWETIDPSKQSEPLSARDSKRKAAVAA